MVLNQLFVIEKKPLKGLMWFEWAVLAYTLFTLIFIALTYDRLTSPTTLIAGRVRIMAMMAALWLAYRLMPCRLMRLMRVVGQMALLGWWYPDTYELNRIFPNFDHIFATWEQQIIGHQPALLFSQLMPQHWFSELMDLGYVSYFPMIVLILLYYFFLRYEEFERMVFILATAFFTYYVVFVFLPVTGPQYYYGAIGIENVVRGVFPNVGDYFATNTARLMSPGWTDGIFYRMVESAHCAGERPTAAFPSSHVGITAIILLMACRTRSRWLIWLIVTLFVLMIFATVYIQAHYAIDAAAGLVSGIFLYYFLYAVSKHAKKQNDI